MTSHRKQILDWVRQGHLNEDSLGEALRLAEADPSPMDWRHFIDRLMLWLGTIFMAAGVIFFFAFNWHEMSRYTKLGLVEFLIVVTVALCWKLGLDKLSGKAALLALTLLIGALLALVGQIYQTGADPWQLFATWALMVIPWVAIGRFGALLLCWVGLVNVSLALYFQAFPRFFGLVGVLFSTEALLWALFAFNTVILCFWEFAAQRQVDWLSERWPLRVLAVASGGLITTLAIWAIFDFRSFSIFGLLGYFVWLATAYFIYRHKFLDIFVLAGGVLSLIIVVTSGLSKLMLSHGESSSALLAIGLMVIGLSAAGGYWLKSITLEERQ